MNILLADECFEYFQTNFEDLEENFQDRKKILERNFALTHC